MTVNALPIIVGALAIYAIAYRYYSAFIAAKVLALDDKRVTPAHTMYDGQNYVPTNKWVLFGHHFAAITGAGPLIGPVLAAQFGFLPDCFGSSSVCASAARCMISSFFLPPFAAAANRSRRWRAPKSVPSPVLSPRLPFSLSSSWRLPASASR
jgi:hypothetical protein